MSDEVQKQAEKAFLSPTALTSQRVGRRIGSRPSQGSVSGSLAGQSVQSHSRRSASMISSAEDAELFQQIGFSTSVVVSPKSRESVREEMQKVGSPIDDFVRGANAAALSLMRSFSPATTPRVQDSFEDTDAGTVSLWHFAGSNLVSKSLAQTAGADTVTTSQRTSLDLHNNDNSFHVLANLLVEFLQTKLTQDGKTVVLFPEDRVRMERVLPEAMRLDFIDAVRSRLEQTPSYPTTPLEYLTLQCQELGLDREGRLNPILVAANLEAEPSFIPITSVLKEASFDRSSAGSFGSEPVAHFQKLAANFSNPTTVDDEDTIKQLDTADDEPGPIPIVQSTEVNLVIGTEHQPIYLSQSHSDVEEPVTPTPRAVVDNGIDQSMVPPMIKVSNASGEGFEQVISQSSEEYVQVRPKIDPDAVKQGADSEPPTPSDADQSESSPSQLLSVADQSHNYHINESSVTAKGDYEIDGNAEGDVGSSGSDSFEKVENEDADEDAIVTPCATLREVSEQPQSEPQAQTLPMQEQQRHRKEENHGEIQRKGSDGTFDGNEVAGEFQKKNDTVGDDKPRDPIDDFDFVIDFAEGNTGDHAVTKAAMKAVRSVMGRSTDASENGVETLVIDRDADNNSVDEFTVMTFGVGPMSKSRTQDIGDIVEGVAPENQVRRKSLEPKGTKTDDEDGSPKIQSGSTSWGAQSNMMAARPALAYENNTYSASQGLGRPPISNNGISADRVAVHSAGFTAMEAADSFAGRSPDDNMSVSTMDRASMLQQSNTQTSSHYAMTQQAQGTFENSASAVGMFSINPFAAIANIGNPFSLGGFSALASYTNTEPPQQDPPEKEGIELKNQFSNDFMSEVSGFTGAKLTDGQPTVKETEDLAREQLLAELREATNLMEASQTPETAKFWKDHVLELQARIRALSGDTSAIPGHTTTEKILESNRRLVTEISRRDQYTQTKADPAIPKIDVPRPLSRNQSSIQPQTSNKGGQYMPPTMSATVSDKDTLAHEPLVSEDEEVQKTDIPMVDVIAPADLPGGYNFEAEIEGKRFLATVPSGGVQQGETFTCYMRELDSVAIDIPVGYWKDSFTNLFEYGCCHPVIWNSLFCPLGKFKLEFEEWIEIAQTHNL